MADDHLARHRQAFAGKNVLVTGGLGFIGSNLAIALVELGAEVTVLDSVVPEHGANFANLNGVRDRLTINISDMREPHALDILVRERDHVFHLAGQVSHGDSMREPKVDLGVNCVSTMNLVEACRHHNPQAKLLFTSTRQVYGRAKSLPVRESDPTVPVDVNGINKLAAEYYHLLYDQVYGVPSVVLRLTNTYGPRQQIKNDRQGFIGIMIRQALRGQKLKVFGSGEQVRDFNHVDDVVDALLLAAATDACRGRVFNLGARRYHSLLEFVALLGKVCDIEYERVPFPADKRLIDIGDFYGDYSLFRDATGWEPRIDLPDGLASTVAWYRAHKDDYWA
jgi:nucleoside-diphosphate-sugar epimerase